MLKPSNLERKNSPLINTLYSGKYFENKILVIEIELV